MRTPIINLHNVDCMIAMANKPDNHYDLAIVDPEYGIGADIKNSTNKIQSNKSATASKFYGNQRWDNKATNEYFNELFRVSKDQIIWGANYFGLIGGYIYWRKNVTMPTYSKGELAYCSKINKVEEFEYTWHGMIQGDMKDKETRIHPTQKPVQLYKWLLLNYAKEGNTILDTHLGSGSIAIACYDMGFDLDGFEIDKEYFDAMMKRFENHKLQYRFDL